MTYSDTRAQGAPTAGFGVRAAVGRLLRGMLVERRARLAQHRLGELDDHILRDMGIRRGDIADAVRGRAR